MAMKVRVLEAILAIWLGSRTDAGELDESCVDGNVA
jgi:hypothetical protein